jgi:hopanoid biosynthesis associated protein HpnK
VNLITTADDFGRSQEINRAILEAHREGILTSASLMVAGEAAEEAVAIAKENPTLAVGLHLVAVDGPAVLPASRIPRLVDETGRFPNAPMRLGLRYYFNRPARVELQAELEAQFARFAEFGLPLSHVDGHQHMHLHPAVWPLLIPLIRRYKPTGVRIVRDNWRLGLRHDRSHWMLRTAWAASFAMLSRKALRDARQEEFVVADRVYGLMQSGRMSESYVLALLDHVTREGAKHGQTVEIYFHPTTGDRTDAFGPNPEELRTLLSERVREAIERKGIRLCRYVEVAGRDSTEMHR